MKILQSIAELAGVAGPLSVAIGVFDGVHLGHQSLIRRAMQEAARLNGSAVALTFHPHPARILRPESAPHLLTSTPHKQRLIAELGCPYLLQITFDPIFAAQSPETFISALAQRGNDVRAICVGHNWAFGKGRAGNVELLRALGARQGFKTVEIDPVIVGGELVSSTRIRQAIEAGDFATAERCLGRPYAILGTVQHGARLGGRIGFPTANLAAHNEQFPPDGVYAVRATLPQGEYAGVANVGRRPTLGSGLERLLEAHLFDFADSIYGEHIEVRFIKLLRPERKFASIEDLKEQIARDCAAARDLLG